MRTILFLRAVNVPRRTLRMKDALDVLSKAGFDDLDYHLQSGNIAVTSDLSPSELGQKASEALSTYAGFEIPVAARSAAHLRELIKAVDDVGSSLPDCTEGHKYIAFAPEPIADDVAERVDDWSAPKESARVVHGEVLIELGVSARKAKLSNAKLTKVLRLPTTTRDIGVVRAIVDRWCVDMATYLEIHPVDPQPRLVTKVAEALARGAVIAYPTDSSYALGCALDNHEGKERIAAIRKLDDSHHYTVICKDFAQLGQFVHVGNSVFRAVRAATPGPYTFILPATSEVPKRLMQPKKKTVGVRIPDNKFVQALLAEVGEPIMSSTLILPGEDAPLTEAWVVQQQLADAVDVIVDSGDCSVEPTTVIDLSEGYAEVLRVGGGNPEPFS